MGLYLRKADENDVDILYTWANDETVRRNSFSVDPIPYEEHVSWYKKLLEDSGKVQYILEKEDHGTVSQIGQIRLDLDHEKMTAEIGYSVAREYRGLGYGKELIRLLIEAVKQEYPDIQKLIAKVKPDNVASHKAFLDSGFELKYNEFEHVLTERHEATVVELSDNVGGG